MRHFIFTTGLGLAASAAHAEGAAPAGAGFAEFIPLILLVVIFYFFLIRPQNKRAKEHRELVAALAKGDEVVTAGGIIGRIVKVSDDYVTLETGNSVEISFQKVAITSALPKGTLKELNKQNA